jgi:uncharacterized integral membrane protein
MTPLPLGLEILGMFVTGWILGYIVGCYGPPRTRGRSGD